MLRRGVRPHGYADDPLLRLDRGEVEQLRQRHEQPDEPDGDCDQNRRLAGGARGERTDDRVVSGKVRVASTVSAGKNFTRLYTLFNYMYQATFYTNLF